MINSISVIDLFAGPGGLGEGFASNTDTNGNPLFRVCLSVEKDETAYETLLLRAFYRQFPRSLIPESYYKYLRGEIDRKTLFKQHRIEAKRARREAWRVELGKHPHESVKRRIKASLPAQSKKAWVLIGGPPCQLYSVVGRARRKEQREKNLEKYERDKRHYLYREYLRILADHKPPVFVMENVKGILSSTVRGKKIFQQILADLRKPRVSINKYKRGAYKREGPTYNIYPLVDNAKLSAGTTSFEPLDYVIKAEQFGIPQTRHRVILLGIRSDLQVTPRFLKTRPEVTVKQVISDLPKLRSAISRGKDSEEAWITALRAIEGLAWVEKLGTYNGTKLQEKVLRVANTTGNRSFKIGAEFVHRNLNGNRFPQWLKQWYPDKRLKGVCNHSARSHMVTDLYRYLFSSCFARVYRRSPELNDFPKRLLPKHENVKNVPDGEYSFADRFRVQIYNKPSSTITSHISKDGHYYIHPDPKQCRSLTVREAARLQTFPDNYFFEGPRTEQYQQVGNAVPPYLARQIAEIVYDIFRRAKMV